VIERSLHRALNGVIRTAVAAQRVVGHHASEQVITLAPPTPPRGRILISHRLDGMMMRRDDPRRTEHNQFCEVPSLAEALVERGYAVDLVSWLRRHPAPRKDYDLMLAVRSNFDVLSTGLGPDCVRVMMIETTHWLYNNHASLERSLEVQQSRGVTPERDIEIERNNAIENADYALMFGNDFVYETFAFAGTPVFEIPNPAIHQPAWRDDKDYAAARQQVYAGVQGEDQRRHADRHHRVRA
jgi:hypothetical protein